MKKFLFSAFIVGTSVFASDPFKLVKTAELATMLSEKTPTQVFDANGEKVRKEEGIIPGAKLLASSSKYDTKVLPTDKATRLVFYCYNEACTASHSAAKRAGEAGYKNLYVLSDGITGWKQAGQKTAMP